jgi:hypothetical protein
MSVERLVRKKRGWYCGEVRVLELFGVRARGKWLKGYRCRE